MISRVLDGDNHDDRKTQKMEWNGGRKEEEREEEEIKKKGGQKKQNQGMLHGVEHLRTQVFLEGAFVEEA